MYADLLNPMLTVLSQNQEIKVKILPGLSEIIIFAHY
jgi:hypothetical protein